MFHVKGREKMVKKKKSAANDKKSKDWETVQQRNRNRTLQRRTTVISNAEMNR